MGRGAKVSACKVARSVLAVVVISLGSHVVSARAADATIPLIDQGPTIDGVVDDLWSVATPQLISIHTDGSAPSSPADCSGVWRALSDAVSLYVLVDVNDDALVQDSGSAWDDDRVSVYIDGDNSKDATTNASARNDFQFNFGWNNFTVEPPSEWYTGITTGITYAVVKTPTGYRLEIQFPWSTINPGGPTPHEGQLIGFDASIDDDDDGGGRDSQVSWYHTASNPHNPQIWGTVELVAVSMDKASKPAPANKATDVAVDVVLGWKPGHAAGVHDVYFGASLSDVNEAGRTDPRNVLLSQGQDPNTYDPPGALTLNQTYYWRIDEVNTTKGDIARGDVWSFTAEPLAYPIANITATASSAGSGQGPENTVNGSGMTGDLHGTETKTMWLSAASPQPTWIQYDFDRTYKLYELWVWNHNTSFESALGFGIQDASIEYSPDGTSWAKLGDFTFTQSAGVETYAHDTTISFGGVAAKAVRITVATTWGGLGKAGLSEVRFYHIPAFAREPKPASGSIDVDPGVTLSWRSGRGAVSHQVYLGAGADDMHLAATAGTAGYAPPDLQLGATYHWRVDEVNDAATPRVWTGDTWSFMTSDFITVDDFEKYNDNEPTRVYDAWIDGYGTTTNGAIVGHSTAPFAERTVVHGGTQSMPFYYDNTSATVSSAVYTYPAAQDWTRAGIKTLVLYFYGGPANTTGQLYCKINNTRIDYPGSAAVLTASTWKQWNIELTTISGLSAVGKLEIGVSGTGKGLLFFDDIRLYKSAPAPSVSAAGY